MGDLLDGQSSLRAIDYVLSGVANWLLSKWILASGVASSQILENGDDGDEDEDENDDGNDHLLPDLGEGLEDGGQVKVLRRVQVPSNMVQHLKSDIWKNN